MRKSKLPKGTHSLKNADERIGQESKESKQARDTYCLESAEGKTSQGQRAREGHLHPAERGEVKLGHKISDRVGSTHALENPDGGDTFKNERNWARSLTRWRAQKEGLVSK